MAWDDNLSFQFRSPCEGRVEIIDFKPQEHAISVWLEARVADGAVMMSYVPVMQLKNEPSVQNKSLVLAAAMGALATKEMLIPPAAGFNITDANERLWTHTVILCES